MEEPGDAQGPKEECMLHAADLRLEIEHDTLRSFAALSSEVWGGKCTETASCDPVAKE